MGKELYEVHFEEVAHSFPGGDEWAGEYCIEYFNGLLPSLRKKRCDNFAVPLRNGVDPSDSREPLVKPPEQRPVVENLVPCNEGQRGKSCYYPSNSQSRDGEKAGQECASRRCYGFDRRGAGRENARNQGCLDACDDQAGNGGGDSCSRLFYEQGQDYGEDTARE